MKVCELISMLETFPEHLEVAKLTCFRDDLHAVVSDIDAVFLESDLKKVPFPTVIIATELEGGYHHASHACAHNKTKNTHPAKDNANQRKPASKNRTDGKKTKAKLPKNGDSNS